MDKRLKRLEKAWRLASGKARDMLERQMDALEKREAKRKKQKPIHLHRVYETEGGDTLEK